MYWIGSMRNNNQTYEVRVLVKKKGSLHFSSHVGMYIEETITRMFHINARTPNQAGTRAEKYGRPISVRKVDIEKMSGDIEKLMLPEVFGANNPYPDAIAMDEMVWKQKSKRIQRRGNNGKDKEPH